MHCDADWLSLSTTVVREVGIYDIVPTSVVSLVLKLSRNLGDRKDRKTLLDCNVYTMLSTTVIFH